MARILRASTLTSNSQPVSMSMGLGQISLSPSIPWRLRMLDIFLSAGHKGCVSFDSDTDNRSEHNFSMPLPVFSLRLQLLVWEICCLCILILHLFFSLFWLGFTYSGHLIIKCTLKYYMRYVGLIQWGIKINPLSQGSSTLCEELGQPTKKLISKRSPRHFTLGVLIQKCRIWRL